MYAEYVNFEVSRNGKALEVSRSGYYAWLKNKGIRQRPSYEKRSLLRR
jgi:hypothetical protein